MSKGGGLVLGTAQDVSNAEDTWQMCVEIAENNKELAKHIKHTWHTNGSKRLQLKGNRDYRVRASNRKAGRGKSASMNKIGLLPLCTPILAYAGISLGKDFGTFKSQGIAIVCVALLTFVGTYVGSAVIAEVVLRLTGAI